MPYYPLIRLFLAPSLLLTLQTVAQTPVSLSSIPAVKVRLRQPADSQASALFSFSRFQVLDLRADTSRIGIHTCTPDFGRNHDRQLVFPRSTATEIADYLNHHFTRPEAPYTALIILRTLWLSDANNSRPELLRHPELRLERTHIRIKAEIHAIRDGRYLPVLRLDTLQTAWKRRILAEPSPYLEWGRNLSLLLGALADRASRLTVEKHASSRWVDLDEIRRFNELRFEAPIDNAAPTPGVYANFEEFRNNAPSIKDFEIKFQNHQRLLYIRESGNAYYSHQAWGYSDGKVIYIMRDGILCPAWKEEKAFYIPAGAASATTGAPLTYNRNAGYRGRTIYFVDMDTGDIY